MFIATVLAVLILCWIVFRAMQGVSRFLTLTDTKTYDDTPTHDQYLHDLRLRYHQAKTAKGPGAIAVADQLEAEIRELTAAHDKSHGSR